MVLTNYWWLLLWLFTVFFAMNIIANKNIEKDGTVVKHWGWGMAILSMLPYIIWAGFRSDTIGDTYNYRVCFKDAPDAISNISVYLNGINKDKGFSFITALIKSIISSNDVVYFLIIAAIQIGILIWLYRQYSNDYWMSMFLFIASTDYVSWCHNGMRQFLAATICLLATPLMIEKKYVRACLIVVCAATVHQSALLMIPVIFIVQGKAWNKKTIVFIIAMLLAITFVGRFTEFLDTAMQETQYSNMVTDWKEWNDDGTNPLRVLVYSIPMVMSILGKRYVKSENTKLINLCVNMSIVTSGLYVLSMFTSGIFIGRLPIYTSLYSYILLPWLIDHMFERKSAILVKCAVVVSYCIFFYYQMHFTWSII